MRRSIWIMFAVATPLLIGVTPSYAVDYPWCGVGAYDTLRCEFTSFEQCRASALGFAGFRGDCRYNPLLYGKTEPKPKKKRKPRPS